jgi:hypothetical protein
MSACVDCRFWHYFYVDKFNLAYGCCCRYAPRPVIGQDSFRGQENVVWPVTPSTAGCGEFEKAPMDIKP